MQREAWLTFADLQFEKLELACAKCGRHGHYSINMLIIDLGPHYRLTDFLHEIASDCHKRAAHGAAHICGATFPQIQK